MADKILKIRVVTDKSGLMDLEASWKKQEQAIDAVVAKQKVINHFEQQLITLKQRLAQANDTLLAKVSSANAFIEKGVQNQGLAWHNAQIAVDKYKKEVELLPAAIKKVTESLDKLKFAQSASKDNRGYTQNASGLVGDNRSAALKQGQDTYAAYVLEIQNKILAEEKKKLSDANAATQAALSARQRMYENLFSVRLRQEETLFNAARDFANKINSTAIFKPNSDYGIRLKDGLTAAGKAAAEDKLLTEQQANQRSLALFNKYLSEQEARLAASIERQKAIQLNGIKSIEVARINAAEKERQLQLKLQQDLSSVRNRVSSGTISPQQGLVDSARLQANYQRAVLLANQALLEQERAANLAHNASRNLVLRVGELIGIYRIYNFVLNSTANAIRAIPNIGIQLEATKAILASTTDNATIAGNVFAGLSKEAHRSGIAIGTVRESFRTFNASASLAGESLESVWKMFTNINTVSTALHLTTDQTNHVFLALAQIFNKSKVQSEELVKQLGNLLPGAFASFAKANEHMFKNTAELITAMKAGTVFAHETVENFTEFLANRFGAAFGLAADGLNANINRMKTSFTELGEAIYESTSGVLLSTTKGLTSFANYLKEGVENGNALINSLTMLTKVGFAVLIASLIKVVYQWVVLTRTMTTFGATAITTTTRFVQLERAMMFLTSPTAIIAGISLIIFALRDLVNEQDAALESFNKFHEEYNKPNAKAPIEQQLDYAIKNDPQVKQLEELLSNLETRKRVLEKVSTKLLSFATKSQVEARIQEHTDILKQLEVGYKDLDKALANAAEGFILTNKNLAVEMQASILEARRIAKIESLGAIGTPEALKEQAVLQKTKQLKEEVAVLETSIRTLGNSINETFSDKTLTQAEKLSKVLDINKEINANKTALDQLKFAIEKAGDVKSNKGLQKNLREDYKDIIRDTKDFVRTMQDELFLLDQSFSLKSISIEDYFKKKAELTKKQFDEQIAAAREAAQVASKNGDRAKAGQYTDSANNLDQQAFQAIESLNLQQVQAIVSYEQMVEKLNAEYMVLIGNISEAASIEFNLSNYERLQTLFQQGNEEGLKKLDILKQEQIYQSNLSKIEETRTRVTNEFNDKLANINALYQTGSISQLDSLIRTNELNKQRIQDLTTILALEEAALTAKLTAGGVVRISDFDNLQKLKQELTLLKIEGNSVANFFRQEFSQAMGTAFADVITGTKTVSEGFQAMAQSILETIAQMLADAIVKQFIQLATSLAGSLFGNSFNGTGPLLKFQNSPSEKGNIVSNNNIIPFAKGGIPDIGNKLQYFPLANGGIGSLRENNKPEAILPLQRDASGKLGVNATVGGGAVNAPTYNISVTVQGNKDEKSSETGDKVAAAIMRAIAKEEIKNAARPGNGLNRTTRFG